MEPRASPRSSTSRGEQLKAQAGLDMEAVHFQGGAPSISAVVSGEVPFVISSLNAAAAQAEGGNLKILGVTTPDAVPGFEDIPPISATIPGFDAAPRQFVMAPAGTPEEVIATLSDAFATVMEDEALREALLSRGLVPTYLDRATLAEQLPGVTETWSATAQSALQN